MRTASLVAVLASISLAVLVFAPTAASFNGPSNGMPAPQQDKVDQRLMEKISHLAADDTAEFVIRLAAEAHLDDVGFQRDDVVGRLMSTADASQSQLTPLLAAAGFRVKASFWITNALLVEGPAGGVPALSASPLVARLVDNFEVRLIESQSASSNLTPEASLTWGLERVGAAEVWGGIGSRGAGVRVCVSDTGVDVSHPDLNGKMWSDTPGDPEYPGGWIEFSTSGTPVGGSTPHDTHGHGTHTSGTVLGGEASGTAIGLAPEASLMHALILPGGSGSFAQVIAGIEWCIDPTDDAGNPAGQPADVLSMSWGATGYTDELVDPIRNSYLAGSIPVAAAGNCGDGCLNSPGNVYESISIGASDDADRIASFSSGGLVQKSAWSSPPADWPDEWTVPVISAPGVNVYSSLPGGGYDYWSGTSMATPHVAGCAALMLSANPSLSSEDVRQALVDTSVWFDTYNPTPPDTRYGWGRMDCYAAAESVAFNGGIRGTVRDQADATPLPEARVNASGVGVQRITLSDEEGAYQASLRPGVYNLTVSRFGYQPQTFTGIVVEEEVWTDLDVLLTPLPRSNITGGAFDNATAVGLPGVTVAITGVPVTMEAATDGGGAFALTKVPEGTYALLATSPYFRDAQVTGVAVVSGSNSSVNIAMDPRPRVAVMGDEGSSLSGLLEQNGFYVDNPTWDDVIADACRYGTVVVNHPPFPGTTRFNDFLTATDGEGTGVVFLDTWYHTYTGGGIYYLWSYLSDPQQRSYGWGTGASFVYYNVTQSHPVLGSRAPGDIIILENTTTWHDHAWFDLYSGDNGSVVALAGTDGAGDLGPGIAVDQRANNRHVLLSSHGASYYIDPSDWTPDATEVFLNSVEWSRGSSCGTPQVVDYDLQVSPPEGLWYEAFQVSVQAKNVGGGSSDYTAMLYVGTTLEATQTVTLASGETRTLTFNVTRDPVGTYSLSVGPHSASFHIRPPNVQVEVQSLDGAKLPSASVTVGQGTAVLRMGETDAGGNLSFASPGGSHGQYWINVQAHDVPPDGNAYFLSQYLTVEDDLAVAFRPTANDTALLTVGMEDAVPGQEGVAYLRDLGMPASYAYAYPFAPGAIVVDRASYVLRAEVSWARAGSTWTYGLEDAYVDLFAPAGYDFGGPLSAGVSWSQAGPNATVVWNVTDARDHPLFEVEQKRAGILAPGETTDHLPFLSLWGADGEVLASGYVEWWRNPAIVTLPPNATLALAQVDLELGRYPFDNVFDLVTAVTDDDGRELAPLDATLSSTAHVAGSVLLSGTPIPVTLTVNADPVPVDANGSFAWEVPLHEGLQTLTIAAVDPAGNEQRAIYVIDVAWSKQDVTLLVLPVPGIVNTTSVDVQGVVEDGADLTVNGADVTPAADGSFLATVALAEGANNVTVAAEDFVGNREELSFQVVRDTVLPAVAVLSPEDGLRTKKPTVTINGTAEADAALTINGVAVPLPNGSFSYEASLVKGENVFVVQAQDAAGNVGQATLVVVRGGSPWLASPLVFAVLPAIALLTVGAAYGVRRKRARRTWSAPQPYVEAAEPAPGEGADLEEEADYWLRT